VPHPSSIKKDKGIIRSIYYGTVAYSSEANHHINDHGTSRRHSVAESK